MTHRVFLVEDHELMRTVMQEFVDDLPETEVVGTADSGEQALKVLASMTANRPHVLLVDVSLPGMSGIDLVRDVSHRWPDISCVMLSGHLRPSYVERAFAAGARGYVRKGKPTEVDAAIRHVLAGGRYTSESLKPLAQE
ncbi:MAG: response regulator transcription factor [Gemmatimonadota bacterium]